MTENNYIKIVINYPERELFSFLQQHIVHEDVEMFYFADLLEIEDFIKRIRPHLLITHVTPETLLNEKALLFFRSPFLKETGVIFITSKQVSLDQLQVLGEFDRSFIFLEGVKPEVIAHNIKAILKREKKDLDHFSSHEYTENLLYCSKMIQQEQSITTLFDKLINFLPKIITFDYIAIFAYDPEKENVHIFNQFIPPHRRSGVIITPNLEKLAEMWVKQKKIFQITDEQDSSLFRKLGDWGWKIKKLYFFPFVSQNLPLGGIILGSINISDKGKINFDFFNDITEFLGVKLYSTLLQEKNYIDDHDDFAEQLVHNRFSEDSILQLACKKLNVFSKSNNTIFWQINRGFGFLFPKFSYATEKQAAWKSLEKTMLFFSKDARLNQLISSEKILLLENVITNGKFSDATLSTFKKLGYFNILVAPIRMGNEEVGMFVINRGPDKDIYSDWEVNQITELLDKIRKVLEDNNLVKEANLKLKQLSRIFELGNEIKLDLNLEDILSHITKSIRKTLGWNDVAILRGNEFKQTYGTISKLGFDSKKDLPLDIFDEIAYNAVDKFLLNCKKIGHSYFYDTHPAMVSGDGTGFLDEIITEWHNEDLLIIPIETRKNRLGFFVIRDPVDRLKPTVDKVTSLEYYANQAAVAIENANLYENLQSSEERYRTLAETMTLSLVTCSPNGDILYANPAFEQISGLKKDLLTEQKLTNLFSTESQTKLQEIAVLGKNVTDQASQNIENVELELISANEEKIPVSTYAFSLRQEGEIRGFFLVMNDLRVIKKFERLKADFNSMIVHDLRSPMNVIQGFIELIRTKVVGEINDEQEELLDIAKENVKKVLTLIDNFLVASKLEVGKFGIEPKVGEINDLIERIIDNHQVLLKNKKITLKSELNSNLPLLYFDSLRIEQVFNNLLSNAIKFTPENGKILVASGFHQKSIKGEEKMFARIMIQDNGPGIPEDKRKYVFEKYEQIDSEVSLKSAGTGLGLAICKEIIGLHGGEIWVESGQKKGSQFYFTLPIEPSIDKVLK